MGRGDNKRTKKMRRRKQQIRKKLRFKNVIEKNKKS